MRLNRIDDPKSLREKERIQAQTVANAATIDYIAMMTDVEIPTEEEANDESEV